MALPRRCVDTLPTRRHNRGRVDTRMIAQLRGTLGDKRPNQVLVDVGGVGYLVHIPLSTFYALGDLHSNVTLLIHTQVREDAISLYGFLSAREKHLFELLISASGVGPVLALKILSGMSVDDLVPAVRSGDLARLTRIPGVGRKTAERMIVELRDKLAAMEIPEDARRPVADNGHCRRRRVRAAQSWLRPARCRAGCRASGKERRLRNI